MTPLDKAVHRITRGALDGCYGSDRGRRLVVTLEVGDLVAIRPAGTRRTERVSVFDLYRFAMMRRVNCERLEKAREKQARKKLQMQERRIIRDAKRDLRKSQQE